MISPDSKISSLLESPPPMTDPTPDKGIKDFNRQYLNSGMWPNKVNSNVHEYQVKSNLMREANRRNDKLKYSMTLSSKVDALNTSNNSKGKNIVTPLTCLSNVFSTAERSTLDH